MQRTTIVSNIEIGRVVTGLWQVADMERGGTTAAHGSGEVIAAGCPGSQAVYILDKIAASMASLGGSLDDVIRTRINLAKADDWEVVSQVHGRYLNGIRPTNTLIEVSRLVGGYLVEIEAEAVAA